MASKLKIHKNDTIYTTILYDTMINLMMKRSPHIITNYDSLSIYEIFDRVCHKNIFFKLAKDCCFTSTCDHCPLKFQPLNQCIILQFFKHVCKI